MQRRVVKCRQKQGGSKWGGKDERGPALWDQELHSVIRTGAQTPRSCCIFRSQERRASLGREAVMWSGGHLRQQDGKKLE